MARNKKWVEAWKGHIDSLSGLRWIPNDNDSKRVQQIQEELYEIVCRNKEVQQ